MFNANKCLLLGAAFLLSSCNPETQYSAFILKQGYIPFKQPIAGIGAGALIKGDTPDNLRIFAAAKTCFPDAYNGGMTEIRQIEAVDLPEIAKKFTLEASANIEVMSANGTPVFTLKSGFDMVRSIDIHIEKASVEYIDEIMFAEWVNSSMSHTCKSYLEKEGTFVKQALKVDKMSFEFKNSANGNIALTAAKINEMIDLDVNVKWEIKNQYTLSITSPKYIGYYIAKTLPNDPSQIGWVANSLTKDSKFNYKSSNFKAKPTRLKIRLD